MTIENTKHLRPRPSTPRPIGGDAGPCAKCGSPCVWRANAAGKFGASAQCRPCGTAYAAQYGRERREAKAHAAQWAAVALQVQAAARERAEAINKSETAARKALGDAVAADPKYAWLCDLARAPEGAL